MANEQAITYLSRKRKFIDTFSETEDETTSLITPPTSSPRALQPICNNIATNASTQIPPKSLHALLQNHLEAHGERTIRAAAKGQQLSSCVSRTTNSKSCPSALSKRPKLMQMTIDLGHKIHKRCKVCGMEYISSNSEDAKVHKEYHATNVGGIDVPMAVRSGWKIVRQCDARPVRSSIRPKRMKSLPGQQDQIIEVNRTDKPLLRRWAQSALAVAERELGSVETLEEDLWKLVNFRGTFSNRFRVYLYIQGSKCTGCTLVQRIFQARKVTSVGDQAADITTASEYVPVDVGISRIWVSKDARGSGIGSLLLDVAAHHFTKGIHSTSSQIAFSQPTDSGMRLAQKWMGQESGWLVYDERDTEPNAMIK